MAASDLIAERRAELARRMAALTPELRAELDRSRQNLTGAARRGDIVPRASGAPIPMSFAQELLWLLDRANPGMHGYNVPRTSRLRGALDVAALQAALDEIVARHEVLRTTFDMVDDEPRQIVHAPAPLKLERTDLRGLADDQKEQEAVALVRELSRRPFDLARDSQLRASLIQLGDEDHVLLLESHHVASDGWSRDILMRELSAIYDARRRGVDHGLEPLPIQYGDFAIWQRQSLEGPDLERHLAFWRDQLRDAPTLLELPTDRPRPVTPTFDGAIRSQLFPLPLLESLRDVSRANGCTLFVTLLATFNVLLARLSGQDDVVVGTPTAGRSQEVTEGLIGYFINTLALRTKLGADPTFVDLLARLRETTLSAFEHQDVPFEKLTFEIQRERELGRNGLFQALFVVRDAEQRTMQLPGLTLEPFGSGRGSTKFDLTLVMHEQQGGLRAAIEYRTDLFDAATIDRMLGQLRTLLEGVVTAPSTRVSQLPLLPEDERRLVVEEWNATTTEYPRAASVHALVAAEATRRPDAVAVVSGVDSLTYGALELHATALASQLRSLGVRPGDRVGLCADRSLAAIVGTLAILKTGSAYVPLEPGYPAERLGFMLADAGARLLLVQRALAATAEQMLSHVATERPRVVYLEELMAAGNAEFPEQDDATPSEAPAYVMYTSGSTGQPKGVMVPHRAIVRLVRNTNYVTLTERDVLLGFAPSAFDAATFEIWGALLNGGKLVLAPPGLPDLAALGALVQESGVTTLWLTAALFNQVVDHGLEQYGSVRQLLAGGDVLSVPHVQRTLAALPECTLINGYGPTENTTFTCCYSIPRNVTGGSIPIGRPISNTRVYVLDAHQQPVPVGVSGELYAGGDGVAIGYLARPELSAERFVPDPFANSPGARLYRTGDRVRWRADGTLEFQGRLDRQVKIRGYRVEPGEIETVLMGHSHVRDATVVVRDDAGDRRLVAYVVSSGVAETTVAELRAWVRQQLPEVMVPSDIVFLASIPLTSNGKVDRDALPAPHVTSADAGREYIPPRTTIEHELAQIWERLLDRRPIGVREDFFELGGHSLLAVRMLAELSRLRGRQVPLSWLFESSTIETLVARLASELHADTEPPIVVLQGETSGPPLAFVHGDGHGGGWYCRRLAPLIAPSSPLYVLPTLGAESDDEQWRVESMATRHLAELRKVQPRGPYRLAGFCVGGLIALEMASQLREAGESVERLIIIDSAAANARLRYVRPILALVRSGARLSLARQAALIKRLRRYDLRLRQFSRLDAQWMKKHILQGWRRLRGYLFRSDASDSADTLAGQSSTKRRRILRSAPGDRVMRVQEIAGLAYFPKNFDGPIDLVSSLEQSAVKRRDPTRDFHRVAPTVHVHEIVAPHISLITNELPRMATVLRAILERTQG